MFKTLVSCNIRFDNPEDKPHLWIHRLPILKEIIETKNPICLATQEGRKKQIIELSSNLSSLTIIDQHREWIDKRMYPTLFLNLSFFNLIKSGDIWLSETPHISGSLSFGSTFPRLATWAHVQSKISQRNYFFINTHLDHLSEQTRLQQVNVLVEEVRKIYSNDAYIIFLGDFNDAPHSALYKFLLEKFTELYDPWTKLDLSEESSFHLFQGDQFKNGQRIDWIFLDSRIKTQKICFDYTRESGIFPSDHYPVICEIENDL